MTRTPVSTVSSCAQTLPTANEILELMEDFSGSAFVKGSLMIAKRSSSVTASWSN